MTAKSKNSSMALVAALLSLFAATANAQEIGKPLLQVDLELVLAADRSASMSRLMLIKQRNGFAAAFRNDALKRRIQSGPLGRIAVTYVEWSDQTDQSVSVPWTLLETSEDFERFAAAIDDIGIGHPNRETAIGAALLFSQNLFDGNSYISQRHVIDISGNGRNSDGPPASEALAILRPFGTTVNGLVLPHEVFSTDDGTLYDYFWKEVVDGPGAFAISVQPEYGFAEAILQKLVLEVAWNR